jgi:D-galactarolactone isomerase
LIKHQTEAIFGAEILMNTMPNVCDCHIHCFGPQDLYPVAATSPFPAPDAPVSKYRQVMKQLGTSRVVVVPPSAYGKDNTCTIDAIAELGPIARGIAVVDMATPVEELKTLTAAGIRGVRFHMLPGGLLPWEVLEDVAARVHEFGWHVQLQLDGRQLPQHESMLRRFPGELVIDHTGKFLDPVTTDHPGFRTLLNLVDTGRVWVKLSAPYETSKVGAPDYADVGTLARALVVAAPERLVWGSNWPHPSVTDDPPEDPALMGAILEWIGDDATRKKILVDNPATLYGFGEPTTAR